MTILSPRREVGEFRKRYKWMALVVVLVFGGLLVRVATLQIAQGERWREAAVENITKTIPLRATRGIIRDRAGRVIADNRPSYEVYITPQLMSEEDVALLADLMDLDTEEQDRFKARLDTIMNDPDQATRRTHQIEMFHDIDRDQLAALETHEPELPGVDVVARPVRTYPYGTLAAHAVGYLNEVNAEDLERHPERNYRAGDVIGRMGVERAFEDQLRGARGYRRIIVDARGRRQQNVVGVASEETVEAEPGLDVVLTLDMELMRTINRAFGGHPAGSAVVVEVNTGRVRALYSKPAYDLNDFSRGMSHAQYDELRENPFRPLIDKTLFESYFPGSTFKPFSALAGLGDDIVDPAQRVECIGYYEIGNQRMRCTSAHGDVDMRSALVQSCNVYFWKLAEQVGLERINTFARMFGLGERTGIGLNSEARGFLATREWYEERFGRFRVGYTLNTAIGQGNTRATLLQLGLAYGALANGGDLYEPRIVEEIRSPEGEVLEEVLPRVAHHLPIDPEDFEYVSEGLYGVVNPPNGTAYDAHIEGGVEVAGKTGTAEIAPGTPRGTHVDPAQAWYFNRSHAWFAGWAPARDPEVAVVVLVEHGGAGGRAAAPIAMRILQEYLGGREPRGGN